MKTQATTRGRIGLFTRPLVAAVFGVAAAAALAEPVKLRVADSFPVGHFIPEYATKFWMSEVTRLTDHGVEFEYYPAEQLGKAKDMLSLVQSGVADVSYISPAYISDKLPLSSVVELPANYSSACAGTRAFWRMAKEGGALARREFGPLGVRVLFAVMFPPNQIVLSRAKFEGLKSLAGQKIRTSGGAKDQILRKLGAVPIQMPAPEIHEAMSRGTIDGLMIPVASLPPYGLDKLSKAATIGENFGGFIVAYAISEVRWQALSAAHRKALMEAGEAATARACQMMEQDDANNYDKLRKLGVNLVKLAPADKQLVNSISAGIAQEWANQMDERGRPGTEILRAFQEALK